MGQKTKAERTFSVVSDRPRGCPEAADNKVFAYTAKEFMSLSASCMSLLRSVRIKDFLGALNPLSLAC